MRTLIKPLLWLLSGISLLLLLLVALLFLVDVNLYRTQIEQHVSAAFGREIFLDGPLILEPSLTPRFVVNGLTISNPEWASRPNLATVDKFDIRVSLLPLLMDGRLEIISLDFHGVDLLLETAAEGANNFTFSESDDTGVLPEISRMALYDVDIGYLALDAPSRHYHMDQVTARKIPEEPVKMEILTVVNSVPVTISLRGERDDKQLHLGWDVELAVNADDIALKISGSFLEPSRWDHGAYRLDFKGDNLKTLGELLAYNLPDTEPYELGANIKYSNDKQLEISELSGFIGRNDFQGEIHLDGSSSRDAVNIRLNSQRLNINDFYSEDSMVSDSDPIDLNYFKQHLNQSIDIHMLEAVDVDIDLKIQRIDGLTKSVNDIALRAQTDYQQLKFSLTNATVDNVKLKGDAVRSWHTLERDPAKESINLQTLLEQTEFNFIALPADPGYQYATTIMERPLEFTLSSLEASVRPDSPLTLQAEGMMNDEKVMLKFSGRTLADFLQKSDEAQQDMELEIIGESFRFEAAGDVARPFHLDGFDIQYDLSGAGTQALLPFQDDYSLSGHYIEQPDHSLIEELKIKVGHSDLGGRMAMYWQEDRPRIVANLDAKKIVLDELLLFESGDETTGIDWDQPLDIAELGLFDFKAKVNVHQLEGFGKSFHDIVLEVRSNDQTLTLSPFQVVFDDMQADVRIELPWGERLSPEGHDVSLVQLLSQIDVELKTQLSDGQLNYQKDLLGQTFDLQLTSLKAITLPGDVLRINATALLNDQSVSGSLKMESLTDILQRPAGPWNDLSLKLKMNDINFQASGRIEQPLDAAGFDVQFALSGIAIESLKSWYQFLIPLEGAYSVNGHFADQEDIMIFDNLKILSGKNDIGGSVSIQQGQYRPRIGAILYSKNIYLSELLPEKKIKTIPDTDRRVIPDYEIPVQSLQAFDAKLSFYAKHIQTVRGELGDMIFRIKLEDGVLNLTPFEVRGPHGANINSGLTIDTSEDPPYINVQWNAHQVNLGLLLADSGIAETFNGKIDMSLELSGRGHTRQEILEHAEGHLFIAGKNGQFGSRRLDLWGSDLLLTMLSRNWRTENVTNINCMIASIDIEDGIAISDNLLLDTSRITIGAAGTLDLSSEKINMVFAPRPKRTSLLSLSNPVRLTGTLVTPEVSVTRLTGTNMTGLLAGLINPGYMIFTLSQTGSGRSDPCALAMERAMAMKQRSVEIENLENTSSGFSLFPGCTPR